MNLLKEQFNVLDKAASSTDDCLEVFGRYVTTELRAVKNIQAQRWAKLQIQNIMFSAHTEAQQSHPMPQQFQYYEPFRNRHMALASHSLSVNEPWSPTLNLHHPLVMDVVKQVIELKLITCMINSYFQIMLTQNMT